MFKYLKLNELVFIGAGLFTLAAVPFLEAAGFGLWLPIKIIYLVGIVIYVWNRNI